MMIDHSTLTRQVYLRGLVTASTGLHLGKGSSFDVTENDSPVMRDADGRPFVPGSSFRGVLRSAIEALVRAQSVEDRFWSCDPLGAPPPGPIDTSGQRDPGVSCSAWIEAVLRERANEKIEGRDRAALAWEHSCTVCRLFGSASFASRVRVADLYMPSKEVALVDVRDGVGIDRDKRVARKGIKYDFEVVAAGSTFDLEIVADNPTEAEVGLLLSGLHMIDSGLARVGGKTSRGLGHLRVELEEPVAVAARDILLGREPEHDEERRAPAALLALYETALLELAQDSQA